MDKLLCNIFGSLNNHEVAIDNLSRNMKRVSRHNKMLSFGLALTTLCVYTLTKEVSRLQTEVEVMKNKDKVTEE